MPSHLIFTLRHFYFYFILLVILALLISPFILPQSVFNPFLTGPKLWLYLVISIILVLTALKLVLQTSRETVAANITASDILIGITLLYILIRQYFLYEPVYFTDKLLAYICLTLLYFVLKLFISSLQEDSFRRFTIIFIGIILVLTLISCSYGMLQLYGIIPTNNPAFKVTGHFYNPARYANYLIALLPFCICAYFLFPEDSKWYSVIKYSSAGICLAGALVLPVTYTRAAWLGIFAALAFILFYRYKATAVKLARNIWIVGSILIAGLGIFFLLYHLKPASASGRLTIWEISTGIVKQNFLTGIGYGNFEGSYGNYQAKYFSENPDNEQKILRAGAVRYAYNIFLQVLCEQGITGFILFISLLFSLIPWFIFSDINENKYKIYLAVSSFSSIVSILVCGQSSYPFDILPVFIIFFINISLLVGINTNTFQAIIVKQFFLKPNMLKASCILLFTCAVLVFCSVKERFIAYKTLVSPPFYNANSAEVSTLYPVLRTDIDFIDFYSQKLLEERKYKDVIDVLQNSRHLLMYPSFYHTLAQAYAATNNYSKAENAFKTASDMIPNRFYSKYLWAKFYYDTQQFIKARNLAENILKMRVKIPSAAVNEIKYRIKKILVESQRNIVKNNK